MNHCGPLPLKEHHSTGETIVWRDPGGSWACLPPVYNCVWNHTATCCHICRTCPKKQLRKKTSPTKRWEEEVSSRIFTFRQSYRVTSGRIIHSQLQNNVIWMQKKEEKKRASHNSRQNTINSKHNQHQYLHFTYLQLRKVRTGVFSFADHFIIKLKQSNHKYMSNSLLWHTCLGANIYIPQALSYIGQLVMTSNETYTSHK